jgi:hypothetical protein
MPPTENHYLYDDNSSFMASYEDEVCIDGKHHRGELTW